MNFPTSRPVDGGERHCAGRSRSGPVLPDQVEELGFTDDRDRYALADELLRGQKLRALVAHDVVVRASSLDDDVDSTRDLVRNGCSRLPDQDLGIKSSNREWTTEDDGLPFQALERLCSE